MRAGEQEEEEEEGGEDRQREIWTVHRITEQPLTVKLTEKKKKHRRHLNNKLLLQRIRDTEREEARRRMRLCGHQRSDFINDLSDVFVFAAAAAAAAGRRITVSF